VYPQVEPPSTDSFRSNRGFPRVLLHHLFTPLPP
jgi:hypothetical protein